MKRFLPLLMITLGLTLSITLQEHTTKRPPLPPRTLETGGWVSFSSEEGRFSVLMPETPVDKAETTESAHGPYTTHLFIVRDTTSVYLIGWVDYDPSFNFNRQAELEANRDNFVKGVKATLINSRSVTLDGYQALEFTAETADTIFKSRVYMVGRRPYQLVAGTSKGFDDSRNVSRFFESFKVRVR